MSALPPGSVIGVLGGGQLGRMLALAAAPLGLRVRVFTPDAGSPAGQVCEAETVAEYAELDAVRAFARGCDALTYEFENVPADTAAAAAETGTPLRPGARALDVAQDRLTEKAFVRDAGAATVDFAAVSSADDFDSAIAALSGPAILKTRRGGYDGKGQARVDTPDDLAEAFQALGGRDCILEARCAFVRELSIIAARGVDGAIAAYPLSENQHREGILWRSRAPAPATAPVAAEALRIATALAEALDYVGVLAVELFETREGRLLVNEIAPRVHNSGHWTLEGAVTSQFEQHIRAVAGWPLGEASALGESEMVNLIGDEANDWPRYAEEPGAHLHLYGKGEARPGRKMGHVTRVRS